MKIVILDGYTENPGDLSWGELEKRGELTVYDRTSLTDEEEIIARIADAEVVLTNKTPISRRTIDACPSMRFIAMLAERTLSMNNRIQVLSKKSLREKLMTFFTQRVQESGSFAFEISMDRSAMADYLGVDRRRVRVEWVSAAEGAKFAQTMNEFVEAVTKLGENKRLEDLRCKK